MLIMHSVSHLKAMQYHVLYMQNQIKLLVGGIMYIMKF